MLIKNKNVIGINASIPFLGFHGCAAKNKNGFTLLEVLIVMAIIAMLVGAMIVAINPGRQFAQARNTQRWTAVDSILNAIHQNTIDNKGNFDFSGCSATSLPTSTATLIKNTGGVDLCGCLVPIYLAVLPEDPTAGSYTDCATYDVGYTVYQNASTSRITVAAPSAELGETISATR